MHRVPHFLALTAFTLLSQPYLQSADIDESTKAELKDKLMAYDRSLLAADPRHRESKKFGGPGAVSDNCAATGLPPYTIYADRSPPPVISLLPALVSTQSPHPSNAARSLPEVLPLSAVARGRDAWWTAGVSSLPRVWRALCLLYCWSSGALTLGF